MTTPEKLPEHFATASGELLDQANHAAERVDEMALEQNTNQPQPTKGL